jgi:hypothetical protein
MSFPRPPTPAGHRRGASGRDGPLLRLKQAPCRVTHWGLASVRLLNTPGLAEWNPRGARMG